MHAIFIVAYPSGYMGCWTDQPTRIMSGRVSDSNSNTGAECKRRCKAAGYRYAGTEVWLFSCFTVQFSLHFFLNFQYHNNDNDNKDFI
jgi:hypothetical protein